MFFPAPSGAYDIVFSGQVIEHVRKIWLWIKELTRICKVGGLVQCNRQCGYE